MVEYISNLRKEHSASWRTRCQTMIFHRYSILPESCIMGQVQSHQNHDPEWYRGIQQLVDRLVDQYDDVLHISVEIRFGILRRWEKGRSYKYGGLCLLGRLGCEMRCSREGRGPENEWLKSCMMVSEEKRWRMKLNEGLRVEGTDGAGLGTNKVEDQVGGGEMKQPNWPPWRWVW